MCQRMFNVLNFPTYQNKTVGAIHVGNMGLGHDDETWQIFVLKSERVMGMDYQMKLATSSLIETELGERSDHKNDLNLS